MTEDTNRHGTTTAGLSSGRPVELLPDVWISSSTAGRLALSRRALLLSSVAVFAGCLGRGYADNIEDIDIAVVNGWVLSRADLTSGIELGLPLAPISAK